MKHSFVSVWGVMAVVATASLGCALFRPLLSWEQGPGGLLTTSLAQSAALGAIIFTSGHVRLFAAGFFVTCLLTLGPYFEVFDPLFHGGRVDQTVITYVNEVARLAPRWLSEPYAVEVLPDGDRVLRRSHLFCLYVDIATALPGLAVALVGGRLALFIRRRGRLIPDPVQA